MESSFGLLLVLITLASIYSVEAQDTQGFISLDCGLPELAASPYKETVTGLEFSSDENFIQSGKTGRVEANPESQHLKPYKTLRYFPEGTRNCYSLTVEKGRQYMIRAYFNYGNYDGYNIAPVFDLYLGPNLWATIDLENRVNGTAEEILHIPTSNSLRICLVKTGDNSPLISTLELRPMENLYSVTNKSDSQRLSLRIYLNNSGSKLRYPDDIYDRVWTPYFQTEGTQISTKFEVGNSNKYVPPKAALKNAATPTNARAPLTIEWTAESRDDQFYLYVHYAEIEDLQANQTREFNLMLNGQLFYSTVAPTKLLLNTIYSTNSQTCDGRRCSFQQIRTNNSTLPPLLNAFEVYKVIQFPQSETDESDVSAMKSIAASYGLSIINWQGDPCVPQQLRWDGLNCSLTDLSTPPRIENM